MSQALIIFIVVIVVISLLASTYLIYWLLKRKKTPLKQNSKLIWVFLIFFGILFTSIGSGSLIIHHNSTRDWQEVEATISYYKAKRISKEAYRDVKVTYTYQGKLYEDIDLNYTSSSMAVGQSIDILINPDNPNQITVKLETVLFLYGIFIVLGCLFLFIGLYNYFHKKTKWMNDEPQLINEDDEQKSKKRNQIVMVASALGILGIVGYVFYQAGFIFFGFYIIVVISMIVCALKDKIKKHK